MKEHQQDNYNSNNSDIDISNLSSILNNSMITPSGNKKQYDHLFKIVLIGDSGVGKSCILMRFADDQFNENFYSTIGVDFRFKCITVDNKVIKLQIWDTAGQERFKTITSAYYRGADGIILVYDQTDRNSFVHLSDWLDDVNKLTTDDPIKLVISNKNDLDDEKTSNEEMKNFTNKFGIEIIRSSAKSSFQISTAFEKITRMLIKRAEIKGDNTDLINKSSKLTPIPIEGRFTSNFKNKCCKN